MRGKNKWTHGQWAKIIWIKRVSSPWGRNQGSESGIILFSGEFSWVFLSIHNDTLKTRRCAKPFPSVWKKQKCFSDLYTAAFSPRWWTWCCGRWKTVVRWEHCGPPNQSAGSLIQKRAPGLWWAEETPEEQKSGVEEHCVAWGAQTQPSAKLNVKKKCWTNRSIVHQICPSGLFLPEAGGVTMKWFGCSGWWSNVFLYCPVSPPSLKATQLSLEAAIKNIKSRTSHLHTVEIRAWSNGGRCDCIQELHTHHWINRMFLSCWAMGTSSVTGMAWILNKTLHQRSGDVRDNRDRWNIQGWLNFSISPGSRNLLIRQLTRNAFK